MRSLLLALTFILGLATAYAEDEVRIGATLPLTGFGASWGAEASRGLELAKDRINSTGGIAGRPVALITDDFAEFNLGRAASAAHKFISSDHVSAVLTMWSEDTEAVWPITRQAGIPVISIAGGKKNLTKGRPLLIRVWPSDELLINALVAYARAGGSHKAAVIFEESVYFESLADIIREAWTKAFGSAPEFYSVNQSTTDVRSILTKIKQSGSDTLFIQTSNNILGLVLKQACTLDVRARRFGVVSSDDPTTRAAAGSAIDGLIFPKYVSSTEMFRAAYKKKYSDDPQIVADAAYDALMILASVMRRVGNTGKDIDVALREVREFPGATGLITISAEGDRIDRNVELFQFKGLAAQKIEQPNKNVELTR